MTTISAKVIADSLAPHGGRITTMSVTYPRIIHAEYMTHRVFCIAGDAELEFDLPSGSSTSDRRCHRMRIDDFVDKWLNGARRIGSKPKVDCDLTWVKEDEVYDARDIARKLEMANPSGVHAACRRGALQAWRGADGRAWIATGAAVLEWRRSTPDENRFDMRSRLSAMRIRQLNEKTGDIQWSRVVDAIESGVKPVYELIAGDYKVAATADHRIFTENGWKRLGDIVVGEHIATRRFGLPEEEHLDPKRLLKIGGRWRSRWQIEVRREAQAIDPICRRCRIRNGVDIHHVVPVYKDPSLAFEPRNITLLCEECHDEMHACQDWQVSQRLYGAMEPVTEIRFRGEEPTYDLEIAGEFPNFLANGIVVHNSRNASSSRAIPVNKMIQSVLDNPFIPIHCGKNQKGMQADQEVDAATAAEAEKIWLDLRDKCVEAARKLVDLGIHKQIANRPLEWCGHISVVMTSTEWANWFALRYHGKAQPEICQLAKVMWVAYQSSTPRQILDTDMSDPWFWHLPYVLDEERSQFAVGELLKRSTARCARVSYLNHDGTTPDAAKDHALFEGLVGDVPKHMSPTEHQAMPLGLDSRYERRGNFIGWLQHRKTIADENITEFTPPVNV
jgi:5-methylcytosine-specific restriction endonuclease McrA